MLRLLNNHDHLFQNYLDSITVSKFYTQKSLSVKKEIINDFIIWYRENSNISEEKVVNQYLHFLLRDMGKNETDTSACKKEILDYLAWFDTQMQPSNKSTKNGYIVCMGASAGGLEALEQFFSSPDINPNISYIVIQHLSPDFKSMMPEILGRVTPLPIKTIEDGMLIEAGHIYLNNPRSDISINGSYFVQKEKVDEHALHLPINACMKSLVIERKEKAIAVILSGTGRDGSLGVQDVNQSGGLVIVQDAASALYASMPNSAAVSGPAHMILKPEKMPEAINKYVQTGFIPDKDEELAGIAITAENAFSYLLSLLQKGFGIDFNSYKNATLVRRIERRMKLGLHKNLEEFVGLVQHDEELLDELYRDILVDVTSFFRDEEAFSVLENDVIPKMVSGKSDGDTLRIWASSCASGEEAYSLAILFHEEIKKQKKKLDFKIFATDAHKGSILRASAGIYDEVKISALREEHRESYFEKVDEDHYKISKEIRESIIFAPHDILSDGVFPNIDFVSCRNMLIYLRAEAQLLALTQLSNSLNMGGILFLGSSEHLGNIGEYFETLNSKWRIYKKSHTLPLSVDAPVGKYLPFHVPTTRSSNRRTELGWEKDLIKAIAPNGFLVDAQGNLLELFGYAKEFVHFRAGRINLSLANILDEPLATTVKSGLYNVRSSHHPFTLRGIKLNSDANVNLNVTFTPFEFKKNDLLIKHYFIEIKKQSVDKKGVNIEVRSEDLDRVIGLERELEFTRENLQASLEEVETTNEELQSTNEEMIASNEELQSTNEELSSVNEELITVNAEYQSQNSKLNQINSDLENLLRNTETLAIFLDKNLAIRMITPSAYTLFELLETDIGRPIHHFAPFLNFGSNTIDDVCRAALKGRRTDTSLILRNNMCLELNALPYENEDRGIKSIDGVILRFFNAPNVADKNDTDVNKFDSKLYLETRDCMTLVDANGLVKDINEFGCVLKEIDDIDLFKGLPWSSFWPDPNMVDNAIVAAKQKGFSRFNTYCPTIKGTPRWWDVHVIRIKDPETNNLAFMCVSRDITQIKQKEVDLIRAMK